MLFSAFFLVWSLNQPSWQWPVDPGKGLTSSFGEYRGARFHMGLDMSTGGVEGIPVRPAAAGTVIKVRAQSRGYGLAVYVVHEGGFTTVYGHLAAFGPKLKAAIRAKGYHPHKLFGTLLLRTTVGKEDILAYSGETGGGLPHLHFELRDGQNHARDPLDFDFPPLPKNQAQAVLAGVYFLPLQADSSINGGNMPFFAPTKTTKLRAAGKLGLLISAYVPGLRGSRLGCRGVRLYQDDHLIGSWLPRNIDYDHYRRGPLIHDQACSGFGPTTFSYCFDERGNFLDGLSDFRQDGAVTVTSATRIAIELMDIPGRWRRYELILDPSAPVVAATPPLPLPTQPTTFKLNAFGARLSATGEVAGTLQSPTGMMGLAAHRSVAVDLGSEAASELVWRADRGVLKRTVGLLPQETAFDYSIGSWRLRGQDLKRLPALAVILEPADRKITANVLEYVSPVLRFGRNGLSSKGLRIDYNLSGVANPEQVGLYAWSYVKKKWRHWGSLGSKSGGVAVDYFTPLVAARDLMPPKIRKPKFHTYFTGRRVVIPMGDRGSGINTDSIVVRGAKGTVTGQFDYDRGWLILPVGALGPWTVSLSDNAGHNTRVAGLKL